MKRTLALIVAVALSACSGGGGGVQALPAQSNSGGNAGTTVNLRVTVPSAASASSAQRRGPSYISSSTQSIKINVTPQDSTASVSGFPMTANLTTGSSGCSAASSGVVCTMSFNLAPGSYLGSFTTYDQANGAGNVLSNGQSLPFTVTLNAANSIPISLGGVALSMNVLAGPNVTAAQQAVWALAAGASGTILAYGVDADGNTIMGAGSPVTTATTDNAAMIAVTQPTATSPNTIGLTSAGASAIAHVTIGVAGFTQTMTIQPPTMALLYNASTGVHVFDMTGKDVTPHGGIFGQTIYMSGLTYDASTGVFYATVWTPTNYIIAFDKTGTLHTLNGAVQGLSTVFGIAYDAASNLLYVGGQSNAYDPAGVPTALSGALPNGNNIAYDPVNAYVDVAAGFSIDSYQANGTLASSFSTGSNQTTGVGYDPLNGFLYVSVVYPHTNVMVYSTAGVQQATAGSFIYNTALGTGEQPGSIAVDPATGNVFIGTNAANPPHIYGYDQNGNALPAPWTTVTGIGAPSGAAGMVLVAP